MAQAVTEPAAPGRAGADLAGAVVGGGERIREGQLAPPDRGLVFSMPRKAGNEFPHPGH